MAINPKSRDDLDRVIRNIGNAFRATSMQVSDIVGTVALLNDTALGVLGYDASEITVIRNFATACSDIATEIDTHQTLFKSVGSILVI